MVVERRQRRKPLVLASTQSLLDSLPGDRPPPPPQESLRLRAGVLRFPFGGGGGSEFGELTSFVALPAPALRRLAVVTGTPVLVKNADNNFGRIVKAILFDHPSLDESRTQQTDHVASASPHVPRAGCV